MPKKKKRTNPHVMVPGDDGSPEPRRRLYLSVEETEKRLEPFEREAQAGVPDVELARLAVVSVSSVRFWRKKKEIRQEKGGRRPVEAATAIAMNLLGEPLGDVLQRTRTSILEGEWAPPEYVVRTGVNYDALMHQLWALTQHGFSVKEIANAHGYTEQTVTQALVVFERHRDEKRNG